MNQPIRPSSLFNLNLYELNFRLTQLYDNFESIFPFKKGCFLRKSSNQSIPNTTITPITWDLFETQENIKMLPVSTPSRITILEDGLYDISYTVAFANGAGNRRRAFLSKNGLNSLNLQNYAIVQVGPVTTYETVISATCIMSCMSNDYIELNVFQDSGIALNVLGKAAIETCIQIRQRF